MHGDALAFDLPGEIAQLQREPAWERGDRNAKTLVQEPGLRVVLVALKPGARLDDHQSHAQVTVHMLDGRLLVHLADRTIEAFADRLVSIETGVAHELEALEASVFLLTIAGTRTGPTRPGGRSRRAARAVAAAPTATGAHAARAGQNWEDDGGRAADKE
jgi:quercetin dioxygenase-like cupin family protein